MILVVELVDFLGYCEEFYVWLCCLFEVSGYVMGDLCVLDMCFNFYFFGYDFWLVFEVFVV